MLSKKTFKLSNETYEFSLYQATKVGQDSVVVNLLERGVNPSNYKDPQGNTALHIAVMKNNPNLVAMLLEHKADFLHENNAKENPIAIATDNNFWGCVLEFGKYNEKHPSSELAEQLGYPVLFAVRMGEAGKEYVIKLLNGKVNLNSWNYLETETFALHVAASQNSVHIAQLLIEKGADITEKNMAGETPAFVAAKKGNWDCVNILMQNKNSADDLDDQFDQVLLYAVMAGKIDVVRALLEKGVSPNYRNDKKNTPLHVAMMDKNPEIIALLLAHKADTQIKNRAKKTPLDLLRAFEENWDCIVEFAKYNEKNPTPEISQALSILLINTLKAEPYREDRVVLLLNGKADVNGYRDPDTKQTALHFAATNNLSYIVLALLKAGADMMAVDINGDSAVTLAAKSKNWGCVKVLARFKNNNATFKDHLDRERLLAAKDIRSNDAFDRALILAINANKASEEVFDRALLLAVCANQSDVVEDLLKAGANPNNHEVVMPESRNLPLHEAACLKSSHLMGLLVTFKANGGLKNIAGETPVDITSKLEDWGNLHMYDSPHYFSREIVRKILFMILIASERQKQSCFFALLPFELRELIFQHAFSAFAPNDFHTYLSNIQNDLLLCSIKALYKHITVQSQKKPGLFSPNPIKFPPEIKALSQQLHSVCDEISSRQTKVDACNQLIADFIENYQREPSWSSAGIDLLIRFHLIDDSYKAILTGYIRQVNVFRLAIDQMSSSDDKDPTLYILGEQLKLIYDFRGDSHPSTIEEQMKKKIKAFVDRYGQEKEAIALLAQFDLLPKQSLFESLTFRSL